MAITGHLFLYCFKMVAHPNGSSKLYFHEADGADIKDSLEEVCRRQNK